MVGSIPACAGEPPHCSGTCRFNRVYPRVCGGTHFPIYRLAQTTRSIPACAGEPWPRCRFWRPTGVYPRVCGGTVCLSICQVNDLRVYPRVCGGTRYVTEREFMITGLSPRVRGNHKLPAIPGVNDRSIPACAGEPITFGATKEKEPVYPRVCGGTRPRSRPSSHASGLSPRVRGNL